jgi:phosphatidylethanolamine-binding protein
VFWKACPNRYYTLMMADYDNPTREIYQIQVKHWLVVNIPGNDVSLGEVKS